MQAPPRHHLRRWRRARLAVGSRRRARARERARARASRSLIAKLWFVETLICFEYSDGSEGHQQPRKEKVDKVPKAKTVAQEARQAMDKPAVSILEWPILRTEVERSEHAAFPQFALKSKTDTCVAFSWLLQNHTQLGK